MPQQTNYFMELGRATAAALARDPAARQRVQAAADRAIQNHLKGPQARDALPSAMRPRGPARDQEEMAPQAGAPLDAQQCISAIQMMLEQLPPDQQDALVAALSQLIQEAHSDGNGNGGNGYGGTNGEALDEGGTIGGRFGQIPPNERGAPSGDKRRQANDRALRASNNSSFQSRWGAQLGNLEIWGKH